MKIYNLVSIAIGAGLGAMLRYEIFLLTQRLASSFYYATAIVNVLGSFFIGILFVFLSNNSQNNVWQLFLVVGLLGSFTTFSTFSLDVIKLLTTGHMSQAVSYILFQIIFGLGFCFLGIKIGTLFFSK